MDSKDLRHIASVYEAVYGGAKKVEKKDNRLVVTAADKKANTKAYQNYKAGNKAYKAADHLGEGKAESPEAEEEKDKKDDDLAGAPNGKGKKKAKRWWDDDGDGKGYEDGEVDGKFPDKDGSKKKKVKEQNELVSKEVKDLQKAAKTGKGKYAAKADKLAEDKDTPKQVAAVIDMYRSKKGTGEAVKDTEEGKKKAAKKERDYAAWEREKMKQDDPDWKHKKGSTTESVDAEYIEIVQQIKSAETQADIKRWGALKESGKFTDEELDTIIENDLDAILVRLESAEHRRNPEGSIKDRFKSRQTDPSKDNFTGIGDSIADIMKQNAAMKKAAAAKKVKKEEFELDEAERDLGDRLHRKRKLYDKTTSKAMDYARREGEAAGHARYRMSSISREMDGIRAKMKEKEKK
jgi:hypothetical protein